MFLWNLHDCNEELRPNYQIEGVKRKRLCRMGKGNGIAAGQIQ